jgi:hypothetical protein
MRRRTFILSVLALVGCRSPRTTKGDFAQFFVSEVRQRGGRTLGAASLPVIASHWKIERDQFGFQIHLTGAEFGAVDSFMTQVLGQPKISTPRNVDGYPQRMYDGAISGMHIQIVGRQSEIYIVAVGPKKGSA